MKNSFAAIFYGTFCGGDDSAYLWPTQKFVMRVTLTKSAEHTIIVRESESMPTRENFRKLP